MENKLNEKGQEVLDKTPVSIPSGLAQGESMDERIRRIIKHSLSQQAIAHGLETFEEADDFEIESDPIDPTTPYEADFDHAACNAVDRGIVAPPKSVRKERLDELKAKYSKKHPSHEGKEPPRGAPAPKGAQGTGE